MKTNATGSNRLKFERPEPHVWGNIVTGYGSDYNVVIQGEEASSPNAPNQHSAGTIFAATAPYTPPAVSDLDPACGTTSVTLNTSGATYPLSSAVGTYRFCNVKLESNSKLVVSGTGQITVHVRDDLIIRNTASIDSDAPIRFVIGKAFEIDTSTPLGVDYSPTASWKDPRKLKFDLANSGTEAVKLKAPSGSVHNADGSPTLRLYGQVYAPNRLIETTGGRIKVFGNLTGGTAKWSNGHLEVHNPLTAGGDDEGGGSSTASVVFWRQL